MVVPTIKSLLKLLTQVVLTNSEALIVQKELISDLNKRWNERLPALTFTSLLDPRYKQLSFVQEDIKNIGIVLCGVSFLSIKLQNSSIELLKRRVNGVYPVVEKETQAVSNTPKMMTLACMMEAECGNLPLFMLLSFWLLNSAQLKD
jgi:TPP-dependent indolepyruvate ferredoxin oxidoreductase alpha subunit